MDLDSFKSGTDNTVTIYGNGDLSGTITQTVTISPYSYSAYYSLNGDSIEGDSYSSISPPSPSSPDVVATFQDITFSFSGTLQVPLFTVARKTAGQRMNAGGATLSLDNVDIRPQDEFFTSSTYLIEASAGKLLLSSVSFYSVKLTSTPLLHLDLVTDGGYSLGAEFSSIQRNGNGVGAVIDEDITSSTKSLILTGASFYQCGSNDDSESESIGGAIRIKLGSNGGTLNVDSATFTSPWGSSIFRISGVIFEVPTIALLLEGGKYDVSTLISALGTINRDTQYAHWVKVGSADYVALPHYFVSPSDIYDSGLIIYAGSTGGSTENYCGFSDLPCSTLAKALGQSGESKNIVVISPLTNAAAVLESLQGSFSLTAEQTGKIAITNALEKDMLTLSAEESADCEIKSLAITVQAASSNPIAHSLFVIDGHNYYSFSLTAVDIAEATGSAVAYTSTSLIVAKTGTLTLSGCTFTNITNNAAQGLPLISVESCRLQLNTYEDDKKEEELPNVFTRIVMTNAGENNVGGAVFRIASDDNLHISHSQFKDCSCSAAAALGGVVHISFLNTYSLLTAESVSFSGGAPALQQASYLYVVFPDGFNQVGTLRHFLPNPKSDTAATAGAANFMYKIGSADAQVIGSIPIQAHIKQQTLDDGCTFTADKPCNSFTKAVDETNEYHFLQIVIDAPTDVGGAITEIGANIRTDVDVIGGVKATSVFRITDDGSGQSISVSSYASFSTLTIELSLSTHPDYFYFSVYQATLDLNDIDFKSIRQDGGKTVSSILSNSLINAAGGNLKLTACTFTQFTLDYSSEGIPLIAISTSEGSLVMNSGNKFTSIDRKQGSGSVFSIKVEREYSDESYYLPIQNAEFKDCTVAADAYGGAIYIESNAPFESFIGTGVTFSGNGAATAANGKYIYYKATSDEGNLFKEDIETFMSGKTPAENDFICFQQPELGPSQFSTILQQPIPITLTLTPYDEDQEPTVELHRTLASAIDAFGYEYDNALISIAGGYTFYISRTDEQSLYRKCKTVSESANHAKFIVTSLSDPIFTLSTSFTLQYVDVQAPASLSVPLFYSDTELLLADLTITGGHTETVGGKATTVSCETTKSVIDCSSGSLTLKGVTFNHFKLTAAVPLLAVSPRFDPYGYDRKYSFSLLLGTDGSTRNRFENIVRTQAKSGAGGAVFEIKSNDLSNVFIKYTDFVSCGMDAAVTDYKGGVIYISLTNDKSILKAMSLTFSGSVASSRANAVTGANVYVVVPYSFTTPVLRGFLPADFTSTDKDKYIYNAGEDGYISDLDPITFYVQSETGSANPDESCTTSFDSTYEQSACLSIESVLQVPLFRPGDQITLPDHFSNLACSISQTVLIKSSGYSWRTVDIHCDEIEGESCITVSPTSSSSPDVVATFQDLEFSFSGNLQVPLFTVARKTAGQRMNAGGATLSLDSVDINQYSFFTSSTYLIEASAGNLLLESVSIRYVQLTSTPLLHLDLVTDGGYSLGASFSSIQRNGNGVGAVIDEDITSSTKSLILTGARFSDCGSNDDSDSESIGGAIRIKLGSNGGTLNVHSDCFGDTYRKQYASIIFEVSDITLLQKSGKYDVSTNLSLTEADSSTEKAYWVKIGSNPLESLVYYIASPKDKFYITTETSTSNTCGWEPLPCGPFAQHAGNKGRYILMEGTHTGKSFTVEGDDELTLEGEVDSDEDAQEIQYLSILSLTNTMTFVLKEGASLSIEVLKLVGNSNTWTTSLIDASDAELSLEMAAFSSFTLSSHPLITLTAHSDLDLDDDGQCMFQDITRSSIAGGAKKGGAVFEMPFLSDKYDLRLRSARFDNCKCVGGYGGAVYLGFAALPMDDGEPTIELSSLSFVNVPTDAAAYGKCIYFDCTEFKLEEVKNLLTLAVFLSPQKNTYFMFQAKDTEIQNVYTLVEDTTLVMDHTSSSTGNTQSSCGSYAVPCLTLASALASTKASAKQDGQFTVTAIHIQTGEHAAETASSSFTRSFTVAGGSSDEAETVISVATIADKDAVITVDATDSTEDEFQLTFRYVTFTAADQCATGVFKLTKTGTDADKTAQLNIDHVCFENTKMTYSYTKPVIDARAGVLHLEEVPFRSISLDGTPLLRINTAKDALTFSSVEFHNILRRSGNGAVFEETLTESSSVYISECEFRSCRSANGVGIMYFTVPDKAPTKVLLAIDDYYDHHSPSVYYYASNYNMLYFDEMDPTVCAVGFEAKSLSNIIGTTASVFQPSDLQAGCKYYATIGSDASKRTAVLHHFIKGPTKGYPVYITTETFNEEICGWKDIPCGPFTPEVKTSGIYGLLPGTHAGALRTLTGQFSIEGAAETSGEYTAPTLLSTLSATKNVQFVTRTYSFSMSSLTIARASTYEALEAPFITGTGSIDLRYVVFESLSLNGACLLSPKPASFSMSSVTFNSISRTDAGTANTAGASVFILDDVKADDVIPLSGASFTSCTGTANGLGGAVYIKVAATPSDTSAVRFSRTTFAGDVSQPAKGKYIYIDASAEQAADFATKHADELKQLVTDTTPDLFTYKGTDGTEKDLYLVLGITQLAVTVESSATDGTCTTSEKKCATLKKAAELIEGEATGTDNSITIGAGVELAGDDDNSIVLTKGVDIKGNSAKNTLTVASLTRASLITIARTVEIGVSNIETKITATQEAPLSYAIIEMYPDVRPVLALTDVVFTSGVAKEGDTQPACYISYPLVSASSGSLTLTRITFSSITISRSHSNNPVVDINPRTGGFTVAESVVFSDVTALTGSGTAFVFSAHSDTEIDLTIAHTSFIRCKALKGNGGALAGQISAHGSFALKDCKFEGCQAGTPATQSRENAEGTYRGGAMYIEAEGTPSIVFADLSVKDCVATDSTGGNVLFFKFELEDGEEVSEEFWKKMMEGVKGLSSDDFIAVTVDSSGNKVGETVRLSEYQSSEISDKPKDDDGFPGWAIALIVIFVVLIIAAVVVLIIIFVVLPKTRQSGGSKDEEPKEEEMEGTSV